MSDFRLQWYNAGQQAADELRGVRQMALYSYLCLECQLGFDSMRPTSEALDPAVCPRCGHEAQRTVVGSLETQGSATDAAGQPVATGAASGLEQRYVSRSETAEEPIAEHTKIRPSANVTTGFTITVPQENETRSGIDLPHDAALLEVPQLTECRPSGTNLWHLRDWGIASVFEYLRDRRETEATGTAEIADRHPSASEWQVATSIMPWLNEMSVESSDVNSGDLEKETDVPGLRPLRDRATVYFPWAHNVHARPAGQHGGNRAGHSRPEREKTDVDFADEVVEAAWRRQGGRCAKCGRWLIRAHRDRGSGIGAWESHHRIPANQGGKSILANCILLCSGIADCHFNVGHGGIAWSHYDPVADSALLFLYSSQTSAASPTTRARRKRSLLREVLGIPQTKKR